MTGRRTIGILETGRVNDDLAARHGTYPDMFARLFAGHPVRFETVPVVDGALPDHPRAADAWLITGSKHGVYDDLPWIDPLKRFLREARAAGVPIVGVCFGHQILAEAFGGRAEKSERGWGCGVHRYRQIRTPSWMGRAPSLAFHAMHQDQVTALPPDATRLAESGFCPHAMLAYGDPERPDAISIQPHPEFDRPYAEALVDMRAQIAIPEAVAEAARRSFGAPVDNDAFADWTMAYLDRHARATAD